MSALNIERLVKIAKQGWKQEKKRRRDELRKAIPQLRWISDIMLDKIISFYEDKCCECPYWDD